MRTLVRSLRFAAWSVLAAALLIVSLPQPAQCQGWPAARLAPYVPSPEEVAERMLTMARVQKNDVVYDLGAGDGRIVVLAAKDFGAKAVGVEIDQNLCKQGEDRIKELKLQDKAQIVCEDLFKVDLSNASVVTLYLTTVANQKVRPNLEKFLKAGTRVVSHSFEIPGWKPVKTEVWKGAGFRHTIYLYVR